MQFRVRSMTMVVTDRVISIFSKASKAERGVLPEKNVLIAGVV